ncbi:hypothetical protein [Rhodopseudomonas parapalustris]
MKLADGVRRQVWFELEVPAIGVAIDELMEPMHRRIPIETLLHQAVRHSFAPIGEVALLAIFEPFPDHEVKR